MNSLSEQTIPARVSRSAGDAGRHDGPTPAGLPVRRPRGSARRQPDGSGARGPGQVKVVGVRVACGVETDLVDLAKWWLSRASTAYSSRTLASSVRT